jgi:outer membrane protein assembly factor BamB
MSYRRTFLLLNILWLATSFTAEAAVEGVPRWVITRKKMTFFELTPQERTRPIPVGDIVYYANTLGRVEAVHRTEGYVLWTRQLPHGAGVDGAFSYGRAKLFVGDTRGNLYALNARDGSIAWTFKAQSEWLSPPAVVHGRVVAATASDEVFGLGENDGKEKWHYARRGDEKMTVRGSASPAIYGSEAYVGFSDGNLVALNLTKGKPIWTKRLRSRDRFYDIDMIPYVDDTSAIAATFDGNLYCLDRRTSDLKWVFRVGSYGGFLVEENRIYFSGLNGFFYALDKTNGSVIWKTAFDKGVGGTPSRVGDYLAITTSSDPVYLINPKNGEVVWKGNLGAGTLAAASGMMDGWFYIMSNFGNLFAFQVQTFPFGAQKGPKTIPLPSAFRRVARSEPHTETP